MRDLNRDGITGLPSRVGLIVFPRDAAISV